MIQREVTDDRFEFRDVAAFLSSTFGKDQSVITFVQDLRHMPKRLAKRTRPLDRHQRREIVHVRSLIFRVEPVIGCGDGYGLLGNIFPQRAFHQTGIDVRSVIRRDDEIGVQRHVRLSFEAGDRRGQCRIELLQVASLALVNAVDRFDPDRGIPFSAFASPTILGELKRHFRDRAWTVRVPRGLHDRMAQVEKAITELTEKLQRSPSIGEIAERLDLEPTDVLEVLEANHNRRPLSLDRPTSRDESEEATPADWIGEEDKNFELVEGRVALDAALPHLDERERLVLRLRFVDDMTQSQIAEQIGHSQMHVSRILRRALERIREQVREQERER